MRYAVVVPYAYDVYFKYFRDTLKLPRENCLFVNDTNPPGGIGIMKAHNMGIAFAKEKNADWLIVMSAGIRFGEPGGLDFIKVVEDHPELLVINGAGKFKFEDGHEEVLAMGYHLTAFKMDIFNAIGRWDENFTPYGFDDIDMMLRMKKYFGNQYKVDSFPVDMEHVSRSHSIQLANVESPSEPRIKYFVEKWGRHPGAWQWDGYAYPFNNPAYDLSFWPPAKNGSKYDA
jgi:hypothetical protein